MIITPATYHGSLIAGPYISDHRFITLETLHTKLKPKLEKRTLWKFTDDAISKFKNEFGNVPILESTTLDKASEQLNNEMFKTIDKIAPATTKTITSRHKKPWYVEDLKNQRRIMKNRERKWTKYREDQPGRHSKENEIDLSQCLDSKSMTIHNLVNTNNTDTKKHYKTITEITSQKKKNPLPESTTDQQLAKDFETFFFNKIQNIRKLFKGMHKYTPKPNNTPHLEGFLTLTDVEIYKTILGMPSKSCKLNILPTTFLKKVLKHCLPSIAKIVNISLVTGEFCDEWKSAVVWPLIKALGKGTVKENYRPVSDLPFISKITEKCTLNQLTKHCDTCNLVPEYQSAYRKFHSCETNLLKFLNDTLWTMENKQITAVLKMDLLATFDTVDNDLLLSVLHRKFGIINTAFKWYNNFLKLRKSRVCISGWYSSEWIMDCGLPQGYIQGAYLFNCYASSLSEIVQDSLTLNGFMDDHSIRRTFKPETTNTNKVNKTSPGNNTIAIMEKSMHDIKAWMEAVKLKLNEAKTEFIYFGSHPHHNKCHRWINEKINKSPILRRTPQLQSYLQRPHTHQMQSCNTKHHQDRQHKEIPNKRDMPQTNSATGHITPWLCKFNTSRIAIIKYKNNAKSPNTAARLILRKKCHGKHHRMPQNPILATYTADDRLQNMHFHP